MNLEYYTQTKGDFLISTDPALIDIDIVHHYLSKDSYWAENIPKSIVEKAIQNSLCFGVYYQKSQIGFARIMTDKATVERRGS